MLQRLALYAVTAAVTVLAVASCSSSDPASPTSTGTTGPKGTPECPAYKVPSKTSLTAPIVSLKTDVLPVIAQNCATTIACHAIGTKQVPLGGSADDFHAAVVKVSSAELPSMAYVTAGNTETSYLMHKMDGDQCLYDAMCGAGYCQGSMPSSAPVLEADTRDIVRRWITQGAKNN